MALVLNGKVGIITGANQGLGFEIAKAFLLAGANLMICARNKALLHEALLKLHSFATSEQRLYAQVCDVSKEADVKALVERTIEIFSELHILVNNAGIYGPKGETESVNWGEWIRAMEINVFGSVLMCRETLSYFKGQKFGKIIQLSGGGATNPMPRISAYAVSKAAIVRFSETLAEEVRDFGIDVNCIAPGALNTRMLDEILEAGPEKVGQVFYDRSLKQRDTGGASMQRGAELAVFLASEASNGITGKLISAVWDNWSEWPKHLNELSASDVYTLRRITGRDRSMDWGEIL